MPAPIDYTSTFDQNKSGIYKILYDGKPVYVGAANYIANRIASHKSLLASGRHKNRLLQKLYNENPDKITFEAIMNVEQSRLKIVENFFIDFYNTLYDPIKNPDVCNIRRAGVNTSRLIDPCLHQRSWQKNNREKYNAYQKDYYQKQKHLMLRGAATN